MTSNEENTVTCKRSGRKHEHVWPDGSTSTGYLVVAERPVPGTRSVARWTAGFAAETQFFGKRHWTMRHPTTGALLVGLADRDRGMDNALYGILYALERKIERGDVPMPQDKETL